MTSLILDAACPINWQHPLNRGLVGWWMAPPGWSGGSRLHELTGRDNGVLTGLSPVTDWIGTPYGPALKFGAGGSRYVQTEMDLALGDFTVACVFRPPTLKVAYERVVDKKYQIGFALARNGTAANTWAVFTGDVTPRGSVTLTDGIWHSWVVSRSGTSLLSVGDGYNVSESSIGAGPTDATRMTIGRRLALGDTDQFGGDVASVTVLSTSVTKQWAVEYHSQWQLGFPDMLRHNIRRSMVGYTAPVGGVSVPKFYYHYQQQGAA